MAGGKGPFHSNQKRARGDWFCQVVIGAETHTFYSGFEIAWPGKDNHCGLLRMFSQARYEVQAKGIRKVQPQEDQLYGPLVQNLPHLLCRSGMMHIIAFPGQHIL